MICSDDAPENKITRSFTRLKAPLIYNSSMSVPPAIDVCLTPSMPSPVYKVITESPAYIAPDGSSGTTVTPDVSSSNASEPDASLGTTLAPDVSSSTTSALDVSCTTSAPDMSSSIGCQQLHCISPGGEQQHPSDTRWTPYHHISLTNFPYWNFFHAHWLNT
jgi:hypothetical protein